MEMLDMQPGEVVLLDREKNIFEAIKKGDINAVRHLLKYGVDVNQKMLFYHFTPLHLAARTGHREIAELLIHFGAQVNSRDSYGCTPLFEAVINGNREIAEFLASHGAEIDAKDEDGRTPLHWAVKFGYLDLVKLLIEKKADINALDSHGSTPLAYAGDASMVKRINDCTNG